MTKYGYNKLRDFFANEFGNTYKFTYKGKTYDFSKHSDWMKTEDLSDMQTIKNIMSWIPEQLDSYLV
jgi:hypothetical protein